MSAQGCEGPQVEHRNTHHQLSVVPGCRCTQRELRQVEQLQKHLKNPSNGEFPGIPLQLVSALQDVPPSEGLVCLHQARRKLF